MKKLHSIKDAAEALGISIASLRSHATKGDIRTVKLGRRRLVPIEELDRISREGFDTSALSERHAGQSR